MSSVWCPKCKNEDFKEVRVLLTRCERVVPHTRLNFSGERASGMTVEVCDAPTESVTYECERCGNTYLLENGQLIPTWL